MKREFWTQVGVFLALIGLGIAVRLVSTTPNFNAVAAAALFAGFFFRHRAVAACVPLLTMTVSDLSLGGYAKPMMLAVYGSLLIPILWRSVLRNRLSPLRVGAGAMSSSLAFFVFTNAAVWYQWYPLTWEGLVRCYAVALPFLANSLASDLLFSAGFFGLYVLVIRLHTARSHDLATSAV